MKSRIALAFLVTALSLSATSAFATCPTPYYGPYSVGPSTFADYTQDQSCYYTSGAISTGGSMGCSADPNYVIGSGGGYVLTSFTIGSGDWVGNPNHWEIDSWIDASSPGGTSADHFEIDINVTHPNNTVSYYTLIFWNGLMGSISDCNGGYGTYFTADHGDTITVIVGGANSGSANIVVTRPRIFSEYP